MGIEDAAAAALAAVLPPAADPTDTARPPSAAGAMPADQRLREFFRRQPSLGKRDRLQIADWVFDVLRNLRLYREVVRPGHGVPASAAHEAARRALPHDDARALIEVARTAAALLPAGDLPHAIRVSLPDWLWERLQAAHGERAFSIAQSLLEPSSIDVRANLLLGKAGALRQELSERGIEAIPIDGVPSGLRVTGRPNLEKLDLFERGRFEIQDAGSQWIADFCEARRGQLVVDFCAGAGGKTLAIAARMRNMGKVLAFDTSEERLSRLMPRAKRAGASIVAAMRITGLSDLRLARYRRRADVVLVDAPCSGTGTLRRSPEIKWRLGPDQLARHVQAQKAILVAASSLVKPGGKLVYATCSLLSEENQQRVDDFTAASQGSMARLDSAGRQVSDVQPGFELSEVDQWLPDADRSSGFFVAKWVLKASVRGPAGTIR